MESPWPRRAGRCPLPQAHPWLARSAHAGPEAHLLLEAWVCAGQTYSCLDADQASRSYIFRAYLTSGWKQSTWGAGQSRGSDRNRDLPLHFVSVGNVLKNHALGIEE